jgi:hypothetical protein
MSTLTNFQETVFEKKLYGLTEPQIDVLSAVYKIIQLKEVACLKTIKQDKLIIERGYDPPQIHTYLSSLVTGKILTLKRNTPINGTKVDAYCIPEEELPLVEKILKKKKTIE